ncbi:MAG: isoprenylcysteine carboxylmethyltransferase family protein [Pseudomonadota bacterium]
MRKPKTPPPLLAIAVGIGIWLISNSPVAVPFTFAFSDNLARIAGAVGIAVAVLGLVQFRKHRTTIDPLNPGKASSLVTDGVFAVTRNPMYLGMLIVLLAFGLLQGTLTGMAFAFVFVPIINALQIEPEEQAMHALFGDAFRDYCQRTRRWL